MGIILHSKQARFFLWTITSYRFFSIASRPQPQLWNIHEGSYGQRFFGRQYHSYILRPGICRLWICFFITFDNDYRLHCSKNIFNTYKKRPLASTTNNLINNYKIHDVVWYCLPHNLWLCTVCYIHMLLANTEVNK